MSFEVRRLWPNLFGQLTIKDIAVELTPYTLLII
jgi:hypothetical protein